MTAAAEQLASEAASVAASLGPLVGRVDLVLDVTDAQCERIVDELAQSVDDRLAGEACLTVMSVLWPRCAPEDAGWADWWQTPLGRLCARSLGRTDSESVSHSVAASMLGVAKGTVTTMVTRGTLDRHPDGGVLRASVLQRLGR